MGSSSMAQLRELSVMLFLDSDFLPKSGGQLLMDTRVTATAMELYGDWSVWEVSRMICRASQSGCREALWHKCDRAEGAVAIDCSGLWLAGFGYHMQCLSALA